MNHYFWRTYDQQEVDLIETQNQEMQAFEFKWSDKSARVPIGFSKAYPDATFTEINKSNYFSFINQ